jgi:hypothetical protein
MLRNGDTIISAQVPKTIAEKLRRQARQHDRCLSGELRALLKTWFAQPDGADAEHGERA